MSGVAVLILVVGVGVACFPARWVLRDAQARGLPIGSLVSAAPERCAARRRSATELGVE